MNQAKKSIVGTKPGLDNMFYPRLFIECWISFDAFTGDKYPTILSMRRRSDRFCSNYQSFYESNFESFSDDFQDNLELLSKEHILNTTPGRNHMPSKKIIDKKNLKNVMDIIRLIRNNLFHGGKDPNDTKDKQLLENASYVLFRILEKILIKENYLDW